MTLYLCIDDTDDLTKETSTGAIAQLIMGELKTMGCRARQGITRHQLLLHEDIAYTSHNSAMCLVVDPVAIGIPDIRACAERILLANCASSSNPGLAIVEGEPAEELMEFGFRAKRKVLLQSEARELADRLQGVTLLAMGGDGSGIIGALAGVGLRMSGNDGSFRGKKGKKLQNIVMSCSDLCSEIGADWVIDKQKRPLPDESAVVVTDFVKLFLIDGKVTALAQLNGKGEYEVAAKEEGRAWVDNVVHYCERFLPDNDSNEYAHHVLRSCYNCLYRRWIEDGIQCMNP